MTLKDLQCQEKQTKNLMGFKLNYHAPRMLGFVVLLQLYRLFDFSLPHKWKVEVTINKVIHKKGERKKKRRLHLTRPIRLTPVRQVT